MDANIFREAAFLDHFRHHLFDHHHIIEHLNLAIFDKIKVINNGMQVLFDDDDELKMMHDMLLLKVLFGLKLGADTRSSIGV